jgi:hypothetical protein
MPMGRRSGLEDPERFGEPVSALGVQDDVVVVRDRLEVVCSVVDEGVGAPRSRTQSTFLVPVVVATVASRCLASWMAYVPTPPELEAFRPLLPISRAP